jgi:6-phosphogluconolactonase
VKTPPEIIIFSNPQELSAAVSAHVANLAKQAIREREAFYIALSGGFLLEMVCPGLACLPLRKEADWTRWQVLWADERCVPHALPESNYGAADQLLFRHVGIPRSQIYATEDTLGPAEAAKACEFVLARVFSLWAGRVPRFDLVLLGIGEDGHTASLFPGHPLLGEPRRWVAPVHDAPKPPPERITLTLPVINNARHVVFVAVGESKALAAGAAASPSQRASLSPASHVNPVEGDVRWFLDAHSACALTRGPMPMEAQS